MKGWKTFAFNGAVVAATAVIAWLPNVNLQDYFSPTVALIVAGVVNIALRFVTTTAIFKKE